MPFQTDGSSHENGIKNEKDTVKWFNENPNNDISKTLEIKYESTIVENSWKHEGGTKKTMDASFKLENGLMKGVSLKNHKVGTFDWKNTTPKKLNMSWSPALDAELKTFKYQNQNIDTEISKELRDELADIFNEQLNSITSEDIAKLVSSFYKTEEHTNYIIINDNKTQQFILIPESNLAQYCAPKRPHKFIIRSTSRAKTSRKIWIESCNSKNKKLMENTNLRIRLVLNNGPTAFFGQSKSSIPCLKIQQDNVDKFISNCSDKVSVRY